ncbi:hypothetical protein F7D01_00410 [Erythrobacter sp. 3-20A1M]|uniref:hypothetical protein n=1 Tax=Erythrobacter sp. 3-20A1M TaxID=2653850 RepID=UPI001BFC67C9|nr:hypothetical protein [Erythrobacter sp. 3-20A1M]QWC55747.1 hypothetical protein F7D01_00410 [Erythrobacter sp. 3-20A1M]
MNAIAVSYHDTVDVLQGAMPGRWSRWRRMEEVPPRFRLDCLDPRSPRAWPPLARRIVHTLARARRHS